MIIDCISDLHGFYPKLEGGDLLIVAGDLTAKDSDIEHLDFIEWIGLDQKFGNKYKKIIYIAGNHDNFLYDKNRYGEIKTPLEWNIEYLCDSGTEFKGLKIWGSPWTKTFPGMNKNCKAFTCDKEEELGSKFSLIPHDVDILITHNPPYGILDQVSRHTNVNDGPKIEHVGSKSLREIIFKIKPKLAVFGHIHEWGGKSINTTATIMVNASHVNEFYEPINKPVRIIL
jgi:Icc-related predicted phosphoesterase